ncbi:MULTISPECIES: hypothetical protein [unclassified Streptomyces]|uniref:hypothetical protein n=1 Tax=unclassified Streptomyces TaxID=2593676 RepID=UPI000360C5F9|nr:MULTISPECIES: hypothetical protein [unclassified Streptomyces]MYX33634.1 hypothetical protein [Streptomyces sp. SID8377]
MRKRRRRLRFDGREFLWTAGIGHAEQPDGTCRRAVLVRVTDVAAPGGRALVADLVSASAPGPWRHCGTGTAHPTPRAVRLLVEHTLAVGWESDVPGAPLVLTAGSSDPGLPGFRLSAGGNAPG